MRRMRNRNGVVIAALLSAISVLFSAGARADAPPPTRYPAPERIVVMSDILGEFGLFVQLLREASLVDEDANWIGGEAHLVILGNVVGWGQGVLPTFELIRRLESQAFRDGGRVHMLLGYGELQLLHRDIAVVDKRNYQHLATDDSDEKIEVFTERGVQEIIERMPESKYPERLRTEYERMMTFEMSPGGVEFLELFAPGSDLGDWLRSRNVIIRIGDLIYSHGGLSPKYADIPLEEINAETHAELEVDSLLLQKDIDIAHPAWWRELATKTEIEMQRVVEEVLKEHHARAMVVGVNQPRLSTRDGLGGRAFYVDSGMRSHQMGHPEKRLSALEIEGETYTLIWDDSRLTAATPPPPPAD